jgi:transcriptional regulator with XRE-family HTH domain
VQTPGEFVREQVTTVREKVDRVAGSVAETVADAPSVAAVSSQVGEFIREQRSAARVSLRELARTAGVSNPYLSQVERGLRKPSAEILASIARGLKISAESLYEQAGILDRRSGSPDTVAAIRSDEALSERHKAVLLELYETYVREHRATPPSTAQTSSPTTDTPTTTIPTTTTPTTKESA